jgi:hypothetical protein
MGTSKNFKIKACACDKNVGAGLKPAQKGDREDRPYIQG